jgi:hypothetical protein
MRCTTQTFIILLGLVTLMACNNGSGGDELDKKPKDKSSAFDTGGKTSGDSTASGDALSDKYSISIKLAPFVPGYPSLGESGKKLLLSRLNAAVSKIGYGGEVSNPRFIIGTDINLLSQNVTGTAPTKYANVYEVTLLSCDVVTETVFQSYAFEVKGVGDSPEKTFINAFRDYKLENETFYKFLVETEKKMLAYYDRNCDAFIQEASAQAQMRNYDAAYNVLSNIPMESPKCFATVAAKKSEYFQMSLNVNCQSLLASMKAELGKANDPSASGFNEPAMAFYKLIDRQSSCYKEAESIYQAYLKKLNPTAKRNWEFEMRQYEEKIKKLERDDQFKRDSTVENFEYLKQKEEMQAKAEIEGNKKLVQKYQYDELPWLRKLFHLGKRDPFDRIDK